MTRRTSGPGVLVAAPDRICAHHLRSHLAAAGIAAATLERRAAVPVGAKALLLAADGSPASYRLAEAREVCRRGGVVCCWSAGECEPAGGDQWIAGRILAQHGALVSPRLQALIAAVRMWFLSGCPDRLRGGVRIKGASSDIKTRFRQALESRGVPVAHGGNAPVEIVVARDGAVSVRLRGERPEPAGPMEVMAEALWLLRSRNPVADEERARPVIDGETLEQIVRPPTRLLSESASKRLLFAAGIQAPAERLCGSASEAARFASELGGPVVLKLVRPGLERKADAGAVLIGVSGAAAVRRAYHELVRLGHGLEPPPPLGVLVAATVAGGLRLWCVVRRHPLFGPLLLAGPGDDPRDPPALALSLPLGSDDARRGARTLFPHAGEAARESVAAALERLAALPDSAGKMLERIEVHPLVAPADGGEAVAVDAVAAINADDEAEPYR